jgi:ABC-type nitrate/sulfonate/bicarbonate transport system substrate-binding protein
LTKAAAGRKIGGKKPTGGSDMSRPTAMQAAAILLLGGALLAPARAATELTLATFGGSSNLPVWLALDKGYFTREGLAVKQEVVQGSSAEVQGLMSGKYQIGTTAFDNVIAIAEGQGDIKPEGYDLVGIMGVHSGMNSIVTRPEIKSFRELRGKAVASDALTSGYGLMLFRILEKNGLKLNQDYTAIAVGSGPNRLKAMQAGKAFAAALSAPDDIEASHMGYNILADAAAELGAYQGSAYVVRRAWAKDHEQEVVAFIRAIAPATDSVFSDRAGAIAELKQRIKSLNDAEAATVYGALTSPKGGLNHGAHINIEGVKMLLSLRTDYGEPKKTLNDPMKYVDLTYYAKATADMKQ